MNVGSSPKKVTLPLEKAGVTGKATIRDLWKKTDFNGESTVDIPAHGAGLFSVK